VGDFHRSGGYSLIVDDLPLTADDVAIDGGGYRGAWTSDILVRYGCRLIVFEPMPAFAQELRTLFSRNSRIEIVQAALSNRRGSDALSVETNASTRFNLRSAPTTPIELIDTAEFLLSRSIEDVGCLALNIEGSEYEVLDRLIETGLISRLRCLVVQFHVIGDSSDARRNAIRLSLAKTHRCDYEYPFVWERWTRLDARGPSAVPGDEP
jgi:FkbM family methyltransferase